MRGKQEDEAANDSERRAGRKANEVRNGPRSGETEFENTPRPAARAAAPNPLEQQVFTFFGNSGGIFSFWERKEEKEFCHPGLPRYNSKKEPKTTEHRAQTKKLPASTHAFFSSCQMMRQT